MSRSTAITGEPPGANFERTQPMPLFLANTITAVIAANFFYLFVMNFVIGLIEGAILRRWFSGGRRAGLWMIGANYLSAWAGWFVLLALEPKMRSLLGVRPIERVNLLACATLLVAFVITVLVETAIVHLATLREARTLKRTLGATVCINVISYLGVCLLFTSSSFSLPFNASVRPLADLGAMPAGTLYWVDRSGRVMARDLSRADSDHQVASVMLNDFVVPVHLQIERKEGQQRVEINAEYCTIEYRDRPTPKEIEPPEPLVVADAGSSAVFPNEYFEQKGFSQREVHDLRPIDARSVRIKFDGYRHYLDTDVPRGARSHLTVGFGCIDWDLREPTVLPDDKIVFDWEGQIVIFDPRTTKIAFVAMGSCPAFVPK